MDLVVGATGTVGKAVALRLREEGRQVAAMVRGGTSRAEAGEFARAGIKVIDADLTRPESLEAACAGMETIVCTATSMPHGLDNGLQRVDHDGVLALIDAAERAAVQKFIYTSYSGRIHQESPLETAKRACEQRLLDGEMDAVILRPSFFMEVWLGPPAYDFSAGTVKIYGSGEAPVSYVSARDVVEFAVAAATLGESGNVILEIGGPEALSQLQAAAVLEKALGWKFTVEKIALEAIQENHHTVTDPVQKTFAALGLAYASGDEISEATENADDYGIALRSVADYAASLKKAKSATEALSH